MRPGKKLAYALLRWWLAWRVPHSAYREAVATFEAGFPFGLRGTGITLACLAGAVVGFLIAGIVWQRAHSVIRPVAMALLVCAAALVMWNLWTMM